MEAHVVNCHLGSMDVVHYQRYFLILLMTQCYSDAFIFPNKWLFVCTKESNSTKFKSCDLDIIALI